MRPLIKEDVKREFDRIFNSDRSDYDFYSDLAREFGVEDWRMMEFLADNAEYFGFEPPRPHTPKRGVPWWLGYYCGRVHGFLLVLWHDPRTVFRWFAAKLRQAVGR